MVITELIVIKGTPTVPFNQSKKLVRQDGSTIIYYIKRDYGWKHKLDSKMNHYHQSYWGRITIPMKGETLKFKSYESLQRKTTRRKLY